MKSIKLEFFAIALGAAGFAILWIFVNKLAVIAIILCMWGNNIQQDNRKKDFNSGLS